MPLASILEGFLSNRMPFHIVMENENQEKTKISRYVYERHALMNPISIE